MKLCSGFCGFIPPKQIIYIICAYSVKLVAYIYTYIYIYTCMYVCIYVCMYVCMHVCMYVYMYVCIHICIYIYIYIYTHTHTYNKHVNLSPAPPHAVHILRHRLLRPRRAAISIRSVVIISNREISN